MPIIMAIGKEETLEFPGAHRSVGEDVECTKTLGCNRQGTGPPVKLLKLRIYYLLFLYSIPFRNNIINA